MHRDPLLTLANMAPETLSTQAPSTKTVGARLDLHTCRKLDLIRSHRGHRDMSDTVREAFAEYIARHLGDALGDAA